jgi:predicted nucleic acid-binding protein
VIVVDTSVWIDVMRRPQSPRADAFQTLLDGDLVAVALPVRFELMSGVANKHRSAFRRTLSALPVLRPSDETFRLMETWIEPAADAGFRFGVTDLTIAALARELDALVWALDEDFEAMEELGMVRLYTGHPSSPTTATSSTPPASH